MTLILCRDCRDLEPYLQRQCGYCDGTGQREPRRTGPRPKSSLGRIPREGQATDSIVVCLQPPEIEKVLRELRYAGDALVSLGGPKPVGDVKWCYLLKLQPPGAWLKGVGRVRSKVVVRAQVLKYVSALGENVTAQIGTPVSTPPYIVPYPGFNNGFRYTGPLW